MTLTKAVSDIEQRPVSKQFAKEFALTRFGELAAYIRAEQVKKLNKTRCIN